MTRQMVMVGFLQAQNCTNLPSSWRHPLSRDDSMSADYYQEIARILEEGKFHIAFFDDRLAMPDRFGNDHAHTVEYGIRCVKMDPIVVLTTMGMVTTKLGLASTCSTPACLSRQGGFDVREEESLHSFAPASASAGVLSPHRPVTLIAAFQRQTCCAACRCR